MVELDLVMVIIFDKIWFNFGMLILIFDVKDFVLKQWMVIDQQGYDIFVVVYNVVLNGLINLDFFKIDYLVNVW